MNVTYRVVTKVTLLAHSSWCLTLVSVAWNIAYVLLFFTIYNLGVFVLVLKAPSLAAKASCWLSLPLVILTRKGSEFPSGDQKVEDFLLVFP